MSCIFYIRENTLKVVSSQHNREKGNGKILRCYKKAMSPYTFSIKVISLFFQYFINGWGRHAELLIPTDSLSVRPRDPQYFCRTKTLSHSPQVRFNQSQATLFPEAQASLCFLPTWKRAPSSYSRWFAASIL